VALGVASYSIYLWQQLFLDRTATTVPTGFPLNVILVAALGAASFHLVERPCLRARQGLERRLFRRPSRVSVWPRLEPAGAVPPPH
jgi:peptidoglycan/LPS O-acetylase OafA/YrhL